MWPCADSPRRGPISSRQWAREVAPTSPTTGILLYGRGAPGYRGRDAPTGHGLHRSLYRHRVDRQRSGRRVYSLEHFEFVEMDYSHRLDPRLAERIIERGLWLSPTIQTGYRNLEKLRATERERPLTTAEQVDLSRYASKQESQLYVTGKLYEMGARRFVMGTDAIARFGDYAIGMELMAEADCPTGRSCWRPRVTARTIRNSGRRWKPQAGQDGRHHRGRWRPDGRYVRDETGATGDQNRLPAAHGREGAISPWARRRGPPS